MDQNIATLCAGTILQSRYQIVRVLGQGGFGITYEGIHISLRKRIAIKEFFMKGACEREDGSTQVSTTRSNQALAERFRAKFIKEARILASLSCPNIIHVNDIFEANGTAYYVMDYIDGESLADQVKRLGALPEPEALRIIREVADALSYIHKRNLLHLDVKPSNILIDHNSSQAILIDFGVAKQYDQTGDQTSLTPPAISKGYSPIEQYSQGEGIASFSPATDIYALAATYYKLLTGVTPPESGPLLLGEEILPAFSSSISNNSREAIIKSLRVRRERPQDIKAFLDLLPSNRSSIDDDSLTESENSKPFVKDFNIKSSDFRFSIPWLWFVIIAVVALIVIFLSRYCSSKPELTESIIYDDSISFDLNPDPIDTHLSDTIIHETDSVVPSVNIPEQKEELPAIVEQKPRTEVSNSSSQEIHSSSIQSKPDSVRTKGKKYFPKDKCNYEGEMLDYERDGYGIGHYDLKTYEGYWKNNKWHGHGVLTSKSGYVISELGFSEKYVGEFKEGLLCGSGILYDKNGDVIYDGQWQDNKFHGKGTRLFSNGEKYVGEYVAGKMHGHGTYTFPGKWEYTGDFRNSRRTGQGTCVYADGTKYVGEFKDNLRDGEGTFYASDGSVIYKGPWKNDEPVNANQDNFLRFLNGN